MRTIKKFISFMFSRLFLVASMLVIQFAVVALIVYAFSQSAIYPYMFFNIVSFIAVIFVVSNNENPSYKLTWAIAILILPLTGGVFYLLLGNKRMPAKLQKRIDESLEDTRQHMPSRLIPADPPLALQSQYIYNTGGYPVWAGTGSEYYPVGEAMYARMVTELQAAQRFIFLEYFIVRDGLMWNTIFGILKQKVRQGVEVRMMYDDLGCIGTIPKGYDKVIRNAGIKLCVFNPFRPRISVIMNYRDHRKICVVDGHTAFCGGINLADEYINQYERFGHWKDTGVMLKGEAVWAFTFMYLQQWRFSTDEEIRFEDYEGLNAPVPEDGRVQPFGDSPLDNVNVTETAYLNIISRATKYVFITTPYLVIDYEMEAALCAAAQSGIDVRIVTPHIYDKWYVHMLTRSHYANLVKAGVKIYEYIPGFMHGKMFVSDDKVCMVGTCNMDFRSFYLHFECSVAFYHSTIVEQVKQDMLATQKASRLITLEDARNVSIFTRMGRSFLKLFAPLM